MKLLLAPMEGIVDYSVRKILTSLHLQSKETNNGTDTRSVAVANSDKQALNTNLITPIKSSGIDQCVTEFLRVTDKLIPQHVLLRDFQELKHDGPLKSHTLSGVPVFAQLLGGDPICITENALQLLEMGSLGIDLNFGCPAPTVNRHDGGATLLKSPERIFKIVESCRRQIPSHIPVTAKMRLGFDDPNICLDNAQAIESAGANHLVVHARTKMDGYKPPAHWEWLGKIRAKTRIPLIANGDICTLADLQKCQELSGCQDFMIGRGFLYDPLIFFKLRGITNPSIPILLPDFFTQFFNESRALVNEHYAQAKTKQWLKSMATKSENMAKIFNVIKYETNPEMFFVQLTELPRQPLTWSLHSDP